MWKQLGDLVVFLCRQPREYALQAAIRVMTVQACTVGQANDRGGKPALAAAH
jgi:hypothetical protein